MFWMFMTALWVVMLLAPLALLIALLPSGRDCPRCGCETLPLQVHALKPVRRFMGRRWCTACSWEGITRVTRNAPVPALERVPDTIVDEVDDDAVWRGERDSSGGLL